MPVSLWHYPTFMRSVIPDEEKRVILHSSQGTESTSTVAPILSPAEGV